jgi:nicotinate-nucleotide adenylyltransferase
MKKVGLLGGSFDPIHFGHIGLAVHLLEKHDLNEVLFCPAFCSPFKTKTPPICSAEKRLTMLKLALDHPQFKISTLEIDRKDCSYTIDTVRALHDKNVQLHLLLSDESAAHLGLWKNVEELLLLAPPLVGPREIQISSTLIRDRLKKNLYCRHLIPTKALDFIEANRLYSG